MRHLVVCCDGTWMTPVQPSVTNVRRLYDALAETDGDRNEQVRHYASGVGTEGDILARLRGGITGADLDQKITAAYAWLATTYERGDHIALFGFSRGAYTVRSLAGMIAACGLIDTSGLDASATEAQVESVYRTRYRRGPAGDRHWRDGLTFRYDPDDAEHIPVRFIGVWETVGALGIPNNLSWLNPLDPGAPHTFHDVTLNPHIPHARHAVAMDERRGAFTPTMWSRPAPGQDVEQKWFPGSHMDVGGGHPERGLSDGALRWMIDEAVDAAGLAFRPSTLDQVRPDPVDVQHDDNSGVFTPGLGLLLEAPLAAMTEFAWDMRPRAVPVLAPRHRRDDVHDSVYQRQAKVPITSGPYRPTRLLEPGESATVEVFAGEPWNETGLYLRSGEYTVAADGEWRAGEVWCGPAGIHGAGPADVLALPRDLVRGVVGAAADVYRRLSGQDGASFPTEYRERDLPRMALVGVVANDARTTNGRTTHERFAIGDDVTAHRVTGDGYLYAFANDAWGSYGDHHGSVRLTVTRTG